MVLRGQILSALCSSVPPQHLAQYWHTVDPGENEQKAVSPADPKTQQGRGQGARDMGQVPGSKWAEGGMSVTHRWGPDRVPCSLQSPYCACLMSGRGELTGNQRNARCAV